MWKTFWLNSYFILTSLFVEFHAVAIILEPNKRPIAIIVPQVQTLETVDVESSFIIIPIVVVIPTANDAWNRSKLGSIKVGDFLPIRYNRYRDQVVAPIPQTGISAG